MLSEVVHSVPFGTLCVCVLLCAHVQTELLFLPFPLDFEQGCCRAGNWEQHLSLAVATGHLSLVVATGVPLMTTQECN